MIVGYTFDGLHLPAAPFAKQVEESLGHYEGIINGIEIDVGTNVITIDEGRMLIKGRQFEVIGSETVNVENAASGNLYGVLIVEIDLGKESSASSFDQVSFKYLLGTTDYPSLIQQDINSGEPNDLIYQYELARFRIGTNGINNYQDERTYLDYNSVYNQIVDKVQNAIDNIEDGSAFALKSQMVWSTNEVDTGQVWVDGKKIYRKTFKGISMSDRKQDINIADLNIDEIFFVLDRSNLYWVDGSGTPRWMPIIQTAVHRAQQGPVEPEPSRYMVEVFANPSKTWLTINCGSNVKISKWTMTIEYTKTTE